MSKAAALFPMFLKLEAQPCLVVGAGPVAQRKIEALINCGASIKVVAPQANEAIQQWNDSAQLRWESRRFVPDDLVGVVLVVAASGDSELNGEIYRQATLRGVFCNAVDEPSHCHFYFPAVVQRGDLQIAISTAGRSPALAQRLRQEIEALLAPEYETFLQWLGRVRARLLHRDGDPQARRRVLHRLASRAVADRFVAACRRAARRNS